MVSLTNTSGVDGAHPGARFATRATSVAALPHAAPLKPPSTTNASTARVEVWDMSSGVEQIVDGSKLLGSTDPTIRAAYEHALKADDFIRNTLGRNGWDDKGSPIRIVVHAPNEDGTPHMNNAYWHNATERVYLGDGDGVMFDPLGNALDVVVHEVTHAIVDSEVRLRYEGQQGGINESWADVFASLAEPKDWRIGEAVFTPGTPGDEIRDLSKPRFGHVRELPKGAVIEPHDYSGIPSLAAVRVADKIGREQMGKIWYRALTDHLDSRAGYAGAARATLEAAATLHGRDSGEVTAILDAWKSVGVDPRWTAKGA